MRLSALILAFAVLLAAGCTEAAGGPSPAPTAAPSTAAPATATQLPSSPSPSARLSLAGALVRGTALQQQVDFFGDRGTLFAVATREGPAPYESRIQRFDAIRGSWVDLFRDDASFFGTRTSDGRAILIEYREPPNGGGASDTRVIALDLSTYTTVTVDAFALSRLTYHGGGGGPRHAGSGAVIGGETVAWTRVNELPGGDVEGELRVASLTAPSKATTIGRSREWIQPLSVDDTSLVYLLGGATQDDIRRRDLRSGTERTIATVAAPTQNSGPGGFARSGDVIGWIENQPGNGASSLHMVDLASGSSVTRDIARSTCVGLSGNELGFVWDCNETSARASLAYFDPRGGRFIDVVTSADRVNGPAALPGAFLWFDIADGARRVNLLSVVR